MLLPLRRPAIGISIGGKVLGLARRVGRRGVGTLAERALPDGLVRVSPAQPNVSDPGALGAELRALLEGHRQRSRITVVALSLPDLCARLALLDFESWPRKTAEREALVRWRFQKDLNVSVGEARIACRVFPRPPAGQGTDGARQAAAVRVLAVVVRRDVLGQYELACEQAGVLPVAVGLAGLQVYELCRPMIAAALRDPRDPFAFLHLTEDSFVFLAFRDGCPQYLRIKPLHAAVYQDPGALWQDVVATVQFYEERVPSQAEQGPAAGLQLFYAGGPAGWEGSRPPELSAPGLIVRPIGWGELGPLYDSGPEPRASALVPGAVPALSAVLTTS